jgi:hypothetical protein
MEPSVYSVGFSTESKKGMKADVRAMICLMLAHGKLFLILSKDGRSNQCRRWYQLGFPPGVSWLYGVTYPIF